MDMFNIMNILNSPDSPKPQIRASDHWKMLFNNTEPLMGVEDQDKGPLETFGSNRNEDKRAKFSHSSRCVVCGRGGYGRVYGKIPSSTVVRQDLPLHALAAKHLNMFPRRYMVKPDLEKNAWSSMEKLFEEAPEMPDPVEPVEDSEPIKRSCPSG